METRKTTPRFNMSQIGRMVKAALFIVVAVALVVSQQISSSQIAQALARSNRVVIYEDRDYQGNSQVLEKAAGSYSVEELTIGNDTLSSLRIPSGYRVTLYEHNGFEGRSKTFTEDTPYVGDDFNDITSSIKVES